MCEHKLGVKTSWGEVVGGLGDAVGLCQPCLSPSQGTPVTSGSPKLSRKTTIRGLGNPQEGLEELGLFNLSHKGDRINIYNKYKR